MLYVYALVDDLGGVQGLTGVQGEALAVLALEGAMAVAGEVAARPSIDAANLKAQDALVRELHARAAALLPMRFGTTAADAADLERALTGREGLLDRLRAVRGCDQMIVRVFETHGQPASEQTRDKEKKEAGLGSGRQYLLSRRPTASPALSAIARAAGPLQRDVRVEPARHAGLHGSVYHLIERGRADEYRDAVQRVADEQHIRVVVTGPSPPYAFA